MTGVEKLLAAENGSPSAVAARLSESGRKCHRQLVQYWMEHGYVTPKWLMTVHRKYRIPLQELTQPNDQAA